MKYLMFLLRARWPLFVLVPLWLAAYQFAPGTHYRLFLAMQYAFPGIADHVPASALAARDLTAFWPVKALFGLVYGGLSLALALAYRRTATGLARAAVPCAAAAVLIPCLAWASAALGLEPVHGALLSGYDTLVSPLLAPFLAWLLGQGALSEKKGG